MNSLSWLLYVADVIGNLKMLASSLLLVTGLGWIGLTIGVPLSEGDLLEWEDYSKWWFRGVAVFVCLGVFVCALPATNTVYAIAASEAGERLVSNESVKGIANDATAALRQWINRQIEPEKK